MGGAIHLVARAAARAAALLAFAAIAGTSLPALAADPPAAGTGRRLIADASQYPWSAIGRLNFGGGGFCTAFLIGEREALTAAHCLHDKRGNKPWRPRDLHFRAGYQQDKHVAESGIESYVVADDFVPGAEPVTANADADWALLRLKRPIGRVAGYLGILPADLPEVARLAQRPEALLKSGYRIDADNVQTITRECRAVGHLSGSTMLLHDCPTIHGDSGAPILTLSNDTVRVVGMHVWMVQHRDGRSGGAAIVPAAWQTVGTRPMASLALLEAGLLGRQSQPPSPGAGPLRRVGVAIEMLLALGAPTAAEIDWRNELIPPVPARADSEK
jgi:protease YdgD